MPAPLTAPPAPAATAASAAGALLAPTMAAPGQNAATTTPGAPAAIAAPDADLVMPVPDARVAMPVPFASAVAAPGADDILPAVAAPAPWLPPVGASPRPSPAAPAAGPASAAPDDVPADPLRALLLSSLRPAEARRTTGIAATGVPTPTAAADAATPGDALPASGILALSASTEGDAPTALPAWQRPELPVEQRPAASQAVGADAPPPASIPAAALQLQAAPAPDPRRSTAAAPGSEPNGLEAVRATATSPIDTRAPAPEAPVLRASPPTPVDRAIAGQITRQLVHTEANGDRVLVIRLTPAELGTVRIELREHNGVLTAHLRAEDEAVGRAIDRMLPTMRLELRGQDSPLADVVREPRDQRQGDQRGNGQPQDQSTPWSRQQERDGNRQGRRHAEAAFSLAGLVDGDTPLVPGEPATGLARPLR